MERIERAGTAGPEKYLFAGVEWMIGPGFEQP